MTRVLWCTSFVTMLAVAGVGARSMAPVGAESSQTLRDAASSKEELARWLLEALEKKDLQALRRLRVTESEYKDVILVGSVEPGQPLRNYPPDVADYAWKTLNTKSLYYERYLLAQVGGKTFAYKDMSFAKGVADYATYRAYRQLRLAVLENGSPGELATGSIAEVGGRYKFISYIRD
jgi:hypothetical protein